MMWSGSGRRVSVLQRAHTRTRSTIPPPGPAPAIPPRTTGPSAAVGDLVLTRLLSTARLTPAQAVALGADLLAALEEQGAAAGTWPHPDAVRVGRDGRVRVVDALIGAGGPPSTNGAGLAPAAALIDQLRAATGSSATEPGPIPALERAAAEARSPDGRLAFVVAILREADATDGARARAELSTLVAMVAGDVAPAPATGPAPRAPAPGRARPRRPPRAVARAAVVRTWKWILSLVMLIAIVVVEIAFLHDQISRDVQTVLDAGRSVATATGAPAALPRVVPPAPTAAGTISRVDLRPVQPCTPGAECALRTQVMVLPQAEPQTITWDIRILDRCTGEAVTLPGGTVTLPPGGDRADAVSTVALSPAGALAVLAVTNSPSTTASTAVNIPEPGECAN
jgi:hypothetical protein